MNDNTAYNPKKTYIKQILIILAVIIVFTVGRKVLYGGANTIDMNFLEDHMEFTAHPADKALADYTVSVRYADVTGVDTVTGLALGSMINGGETKVLQYGLWQNEQFGEYYLMSYRSSTVYSVITTDETVYVINLPNDVESEGMKDAFIKLLDQKAQEK